MQNTVTSLESLGFIKRLKGQRYAPNLLNPLLFEEHGMAVNPFGECEPMKMEVVGDFSETDPEEVTHYEQLVITHPSGTLVPAYRMKTPKNNSCICQDFNFHLKKA